MQISRYIDYRLNLLNRVTSMFHNVSVIGKTQNSTTTNNETEINIIDLFKKNWPVESWKALGLFGDENLYDINTHWMKFKPPGDYHFFALAILYIIIMAVGLFGNSLVILMVVRCKSLRTAANTLVVNLAVSDFFMMLKMPVFIYNCFYKGPILGNIGCQIYGFLGGLTGTVSIITLSAISLDRFYVIKYPLKLNSSNSRIKIFLIFSWFYGLVFSIVPLLNIGIAKYQYEGYLTSCSFDYLSNNRSEKNFMLLFFSAAWVVPFIVITFSYINIIQVVGARGWFGRKDSFKFDSKHVREEDKHRQEVKLAAVILSVIFLWFFSWTPYAIIALLGTFNQKQLISPSISMIPALFCKLASAVDPFLYAVSHPKFRMELRNFFCRYQKKEKLKTKRKQRIWTVERERRRHYRNTTDLSDVEENFVEIELSTLGSCSKIPKGGLKGGNSKILSETSYVNMFCFSPTFSNKTSTFRRLTRRYSSFNQNVTN